jgi:hypothetical protein
MLNILQLHAIFELWGIRHKSNEKEYSLKNDVYLRYYWAKLRDSQQAVKSADNLVNLSDFVSPQGFTYAIILSPLW